MLCIHYTVTFFGSSQIGGNTQIAGKYTYKLKVYAQHGNEKYMSCSINIVYQFYIQSLRSHCLGNLQLEYILYVEKDTFIN